MSFESTDAALRDTVMEMDGTVDGFDHFQQGDVFGFACKDYSPPRAAGCVKQARNRKLGNDFCQKGGWDVLFLRDAARGSSFTILQFCQVQNGTNGIISLTCDLHTVLPSRKQTIPVSNVGLYCHTNMSASVRCHKGIMTFCAVFKQKRPAN
jgi:hypothetical protein